MSQGRSRVALIRHAVADAERGERREKAERHGNRPRQSESEAWMRRPAREDDHRGERSSGSKDRVLERTEAQHANARLARLETRSLERMPVDDEAPTDHED